MNDAEKIAALTAALNDINTLIYAAGAPLGSDRYFAIRKKCVDTVKATGATPE